MTDECYGVQEYTSTQDEMATRDDRKVIVLRRAVTSWWYAGTLRTAAKRASRLRKMEAMKDAWRWHHRTQMTTALLAWRDRMHYQARQRGKVLLQVVRNERSVDMRGTKVSLPQAPYSELYLGVLVGIKLAARRGQYHIYEDGSYEWATSESTYSDMSYAILPREDKQTGDRTRERMERRPGGRFEGEVPYRWRTERVHDRAYAELHGAPRYPAPTSERERRCTARNRRRTRKRHGPRQRKRRRQVARLLQQRTVVQTVAPGQVCDWEAWAKDLDRLTPGSEYDIWAQELTAAQSGPSSALTVNNPSTQEYDGQYQVMDDIWEQELSRAPSIPSSVLTVYPISSSTPWNERPGYVSGGGWGQTVELTMEEQRVLAAWQDAETSPTLVEDTDGERSQDGFSYVRHAWPTVVLPGTVVPVRVPYHVEGTRTGMTPGAVRVPYLGMVIDTTGDDPWWGVASPLSWYVHWHGEKTTRLRSAGREVPRMEPYVMGESCVRSRLAMEITQDGFYVRQSALWVLVLCDNEVYSLEDWLFLSVEDLGVLSAVLAGAGATHHELELMETLWWCGQVLQREAHARGEGIMVGPLLVTMACPRVSLLVGAPRPPWHTEREDDTRHVIHHAVVAVRLEGSERRGLRIDPLEPLVLWMAVEGIRQEIAAVRPGLWTGVTAPVLHSVVSHDRSWHLGWGTRFNYEVISSDSDDNAYTYTSTDDEWDTDDEHEPLVGPSPDWTWASGMCAGAARDRHDGGGPHGMGQIILSGIQSWRRVLSCAGVTHGVMCMMTGQIWQDRRIMGNTTWGIQVRMNHASLVVQLPSPGGEGVLPMWGQRECELQQFLTCAVGRITNNAMARVVQMQEKDDMQPEPEGQVLAWGVRRVRAVQVIARRWRDHHTRRARTNAEHRGDDDCNSTGHVLVVEPRGVPVVSPVQAVLPNTPYDDDACGIDVDDPSDGDVVWNDAWEAVLEQDDAGALHSGDTRIILAFLRTLEGGVLARICYQEHTVDTGCTATLVRLAHQAYMVNTMQSSMRVRGYKGSAVSKADLVGKLHLWGIATHGERDYGDSGAVSITANGMPDLNSSLLSLNRMILGGTSTRFSFELMHPDDGVSTLTSVGARVRGSKTVLPVRYSRRTKHWYVRCFGGVSPSEVRDVGLAYEAFYEKYGGSNHVEAAGGAVETCLVVHGLQVLGASGHAPRGLKASPDQLRQLSLEEAGVDDSRLAKLQTAALLYLVMTGRTSEKWPRFYCDAFAKIVPEFRIAGTAVTMGGVMSTLWGVYAPIIWDDQREKYLSAWTCHPVDETALADWTTLEWGEMCKPGVRPASLQRVLIEGLFYSRTHTTGHGDVTMFGQWTAWSTGWDTALPWCPGLGRWRVMCHMACAWRGGPQKVLTDVDRGAITMAGATERSLSDGELALATICVGGPAVYAAEWSCFAEGYGIPGSDGGDDTEPGGVPTLIGATGLVMHACCLETAAVECVRDWLRVQDRPSSQSRISLVYSSIESMLRRIRRCETAVAITGTLGQLQHEFVGHQGDEQWHDRGWTLECASEVLFMQPERGPDTGPGYCLTAPRTYERWRWILDQEIAMYGSPEVGERVVSAGHPCRVLPLLIHDVMDGAIDMPVFIELLMVLERKAWMPRTIVAVTGACADGLLRLGRRPQVYEGVTLPGLLQQAAGFTLFYDCLQWGQCAVILDVAAGWLPGRQGLLRAITKHVRGHILALDTLDSDLGVAASALSQIGGVRQHVPEPCVEGDFRARDDHVLHGAAQESIRMSVDEGEWALSVALEVSSSMVRRDDDVFHECTGDFNAVSFDSACLGLGDDDVVPGDVNHGGDALARRYYEDDGVLSAIKDLITGKKGKATALQFHCDHGHVGWLKECRVCQAERRTFRRLAVKIDPHRDARPVHTWHGDMITWDTRSRQGAKYLWGMRCGVGYIDGFVLEYRHQLCERFEAWIIKMRNDARFQGHPWSVCMVINMDCAGEQGPDFAKFQEMLGRQSPAVVARYRDPQDSRSNGNAEGLMRLLEISIKSLLRETSMPAEHWQDAWMQVKQLRNWIPRRIDVDTVAGMTGDTASPLEKATCNRIDRATIRYWIKCFLGVGSACMVKVKKNKSSAFKVDRWRWGVAVGTSEDSPDLPMFFDPQIGAGGGVFRSKNYVHIRRPPGVTFSEWLGTERIPPTSKSLPRINDHLTNAQITVVRITSIGDWGKIAGLVDTTPTGSVEERIVTKGLKYRPKVLVIDGENDVYEPGNDGIWRRSGPLLQRMCDDGVVKNAVPHTTEGAGDKDISPQGRAEQEAKASLLTTDPTSFKGAIFYKRFEDGLFKGRVTSYQKKSETWKVVYDLNDEYCQASDQATETFDWGMMRTFVIDGHDLPKELMRSSRSDMGPEPEQSAEAMMVTGVELDPYACGHRGDMVYFMATGVCQSMPLYVTHEGDTFVDACRGAGVVTNRVREYYQWLGPGYGHTAKNELQGAEKYGVEFFRPFDRRGQLHGSQTVLPAGTVFPMPVGPRWERVKDATDAEAREHEMAEAMFCSQIEREGAWAARMHTQEGRVVCGDDTWVAEQVCLTEAFATVECTLKLVGGENGPPRKIRSVKPKSHWDQFGWDLSQYMEDGRIKEPKTIEEARGRLDWPRWEDAIAVEMDAIEQFKTLIYGVTKAQASKEYDIHHKAVPLNVLMQVKHGSDSNGNLVVDKYKVRRYAVGSPFNVVQGVHFAHTWAAAPDTTVNRLLQVIMIMMNWKRLCYDICTAFLHSHRKRHLWVLCRLEKHLRKTNSDGEELFAIIRRSIYGLPDAPADFAECRDGWLLTQFNTGGWTCKRCVVEPCLFVITTAAGNPILLVAHVDDIETVGPCMDELRLVRNLHDQRFGVKDVDSNEMLGVRRIISDDRRYVVISMPGFIQLMYHKFKAHCSNRQRNIPWPKDLMLSRVDDQEEVNKKVLARGYRSLLGMLMWVNRMAMVELGAGTNQLSKMACAPTEAAWDAAVWQLEYCYQHRDAGFRFDRDGNRVPVAYYDSAGKEDPKTSKCQHGHVVFMGDGPLICKSRQHKHPGSGTMSLEYMALCAVTKDVVYLRAILGDVMMVVKMLMLPLEPTAVYGDNERTCDFATASKMTPNMKHVRTCYHLSRDFWETGDIEPRWVAGKDNPSDILTKGVAREVITAQLGRLTGYSDQPLAVLPVEARSARPGSGGNLNVLMEQVLMEYAWTNDNGTWSRRRQ